jgi:putative mRNA 3-end processing factor
MMDLDYSMPMSDHCDYRELIEVVRASKAEKIYTFHGFSVQFASALRRAGFDAHPVTLASKNAQPEKMVLTTLDAYIKS